MAEIFCLCGSTRFVKVFAAVNYLETMAGNIVLTIGCDTKSDARLGLFSETKKTELDFLHWKKIDLCDHVLILNVGGYIGESTFREFMYAVRQEKGVLWLEPSNIPERCRVSAYDYDWQHSKKWSEAYFGKNPRYQQLENIEFEVGPEYSEELKGGINWRLGEFIGKSDLRRTLEQALDRGKILESSKAGMLLEAGRCYLLCIDPNAICFFQCIVESRTKGGQLYPINISFEGNQEDFLDLIRWIAQVFLGY